MNYRNFKLCTSTGNFYENMQEHFNYQYDRNEIKSMMMKVMFSRNRIMKKNFSFIPYKEEKEVFMSVFPFIYEIIYALKEKNHADLPNCLTKIESYIFIDVIAKRLYENNIVPLTIHDCVIVEKEHAETTLKLIQEVFIDYTGVIPAFEVKVLNHCKY